MNFGGTIANTRPTRKFAPLLALLPLVAFGACASPGPPRPPSLNLPEVPVLTADRVGDGVQLSWTTPEKTTDGLSVRGPMTAVVCRRVAASPERSCAAVLRLAVVEGLSEALDQLPSPLLAGPTVAMEYRLAILNAGGHSAGDSAAAWVASGPTPPALERFHVEASQEGAVLTWRGVDTQDAIDLHRTTASADRSPTQSAPRSRPPEASEVLLRVPPGEGALDRTAVMGTRYTYTGQRVRRVTVGGHALELRSSVSAPVALEMRDVFPPGRPAGLEAVAGEHAVDLSWRTNTEADLAGYFVLRQESGTPALLNEAPLVGPSFQDRTAMPGHVYRYSVVAVDRTGNRSPASEAAQISLRADVP